MTDEPNLAQSSARLCPWCSAALADEATRCPSCDAALGDPQQPVERPIPGVTAVAPELEAYARKGAFKPRKGLLEWLTGDIRLPRRESPDGGPDAEPAAIPAFLVSTDPTAILPPSDEVRREMRRLELEAAGVAPVALEADAAAEADTAAEADAAEVAAAGDGPDGAGGPGEAGAEATAEPADAAPAAPGPGPEPAEPAEPVGSDTSPARPS